TRAAAGFEARATVDARRGQQLMHAVRQYNRGITEKEQRHLAELTREWRSKLRTSLAALLGSALLVGCSLLIGKIVHARTASRLQRADEELVACLSRFETLWEQAPVGLFETDAEG